MNKLKEAITFIDSPVSERQASAEDHMTKVEEIDVLNISEPEFLEMVVEKIGAIKKNENKTLHKDSFIKIFKYTGDFAKLKSKGLKQKSQDERLIHFNENHKAYLDALQRSVAEEERSYEASSQIIFDKLEISPENFERS